MICPCGGEAKHGSHLVKSRATLLQWFPEAVAYPLPALVTVLRCRSCGRQDKTLKRAPGGSK